MKKIVFIFRFFLILGYNFSSQCHRKLLSDYGMDGYYEAREEINPFC